MTKGSFHSSTVRLLSGICLLLCWRAAAPAPIHTGIVYDPPQTLFPGLSYREARDPAVPWQIRILELDLANPNLTLTAAVPASIGVLETVSVMATRGHALAAVNAGFFGGTTSVSHVEIDNLILSTNPSYRGARSTFGLSANHQATAVQTRLDFNNTPVPANADWAKVINAIGGGPQLAKAGAIAITDVEEELTSLAARNPRTALGWRASDRRLWLVVVDGRQTGWSAGMTFTELAGLMLDLGAQEAMNYDGGGSSAMWVGGTLKNRPSDGSERAVASAWLVVPAWVMDDTDAEFQTAGDWTLTTAGTGFFNVAARQSTGAADATGWARWTPRTAVGGTYEVAAWWPESAAGNDDVIVDNTDPACSVVGSWAASANAGYYGTNSLYSYGGTGADTVTWRPVLASAGVYEVFAWWVASGNRAPAAPYTIHHAGGATLVTLDQRTGGSAWNSMGQFTFDPTGDPRVVLSDAGVDATAVVSADAVRFRRVGASPGPLAMVRIAHRKGVSLVAADQTQNGGRWNTLGEFSFAAGVGGYAEVLQSTTAGAPVFADAMRFTLIQADPPIAGDLWILY
jgi:hypothetical protein